MNEKTKKAIEMIVDGLMMLAGEEVTEQAEKAVVAKQAEKPADKPTRPTRSKKAKEEPVTPPEPKSEEDDLVVEDEDGDDEDDEAAEPMSLEDAREALHEVIKSHGPEVGREVLKKFKVKRVSELAEDMFGAFVAACSAIG